MSGRPGLRPRRVGEILDAAIKVYAGNARTLIGLAAIVVVPFQVLSAIVLLSTVSSSSQVPRGELGVFAHSNAHTSLGSNLVLDLTGLLVSAFTAATCVKAVSDIYIDRPTSVKISLRFALRRLPSIVWLEILYLVLIAIAFVLLVIPGIWLYAAWSVATPALLIEGISGWNALGRSMDLVRGRWWATAGVLLVTEIAVALIGAAIEAVILALLLTGTSVLVKVILVSISGAIASMLTRPFSASVVTVLYYDLRVRHEGYDVAVLAEQLGLPAPVIPARGSAGAAGGPGDPPYWPPPTGWQPPAGRRPDPAAQPSQAPPPAERSTDEPEAPPYWPPPPGWRPSSSAAPDGEQE